MKGVYTAMVTPFKKDGSVDKSAFITLLQLQEEAGIEGVVIGGTTGEGWSLSDEDISLLYNLAREHFSRKIIVGTGDISTHGAVQKTLHAKMLGVDSVLVIVPYYNLPSEEGVVAHFRSVAEVGVPVIVYHHPKRTGIKLSLSCLEEICKIRGVVAVKETSGEEEYTKVLSRKIAVVSGNDADMKNAKSLGALGVISVISNIYPKMVREFFATDEEDFSWFLKEFIEELFKEGNPAGIKGALAIKKYCDNFMRLPLLPLTSTAKEELENLMRSRIYKEIANK